jgi:hypothetical protein
MIVEYKLEKVRARSDAKKTPIWIDNGGHWYNSINNSYVGYIRDDVEYYIPSTLKTLTRDSFISRMQAIHASHPLYKTPPLADDSSPDVEAELVAYTDEELVTAMGSWWDTFTASQ